MTTKKPLAEGSLKELLAAVRDDEHLQLCDERVRGEKTAAEVDAALAQASPRIVQLRQMSEPLPAEQKDRLVAMLLQPAAAQPELSTLPGGAPDKIRPARRSRAYAYAAGFPLAASVAAYIVVTSMGQPLPTMTLLVAARDATVLGATTEAGPEPMKLKTGSCLELGLRPAQPYRGDVQTMLWLVSDEPGAARRAVPWSVTLQGPKAGTLRLDSCEKLPSTVGPGNWELDVVYGRHLPPAAELAKALTAPAVDAPAPRWHIEKQLLQVQGPADVQVLAAPPEQ